MKLVYYINIYKIKFINFINNFISKSIYKKNIILTLLNKKLFYYF